ncbi:DUF4160 domain-containing protein [Haliscomenobacter hydrossis]|uniref:DUF4160 domain-containing protein n=1 Tax=Haliscomenobacter hydrossis (strain ATCC 27775 / DSM 1100 / LMG 10767 / O) TaxID=760192 RepID=F4KPN6_HALH1|nr:DUF4160 domain-containing protein [Haliscomenobacter hydrossis]AEE50974.1 hypothetical protein Halhy_3112 [Haliscomenobacter hydrossis DSM 1100]
MPTFFIIDGVKIDFYYNDHVPPHFHAIYAEYEVLIEIESLKIHRGSLPKPQQKKILKWAKAN